MADDTQQNQTGPGRTLDGLFAATRGLGVRRNTSDRWLAGVCSGIANRLGVDPLLLRGILIVLIFMGGIGILVYLVAWALLPDQNGRILAEAGLHGNGHGIALLVVIGIVLVSRLGSLWWVWLILVPVGLLSWWGVRSSRNGATPEQMSQEATRFANRVAATFTAPSAQSPQARPYATTPGAPSGAAAPAPPYGMGPGRTGAVVTPERVIRHRRRRGGLLALLLAAGLAVAGYGIGLVVADHLGLAGRPELVAAGFAVGGAGLALVVVGLTGRRAGFTALLTAVFALATIGTASLPTFPAGGTGERAWTASHQPVGGFTLTAGDAQLGLDGATSPVKVAMGVGQLTITVPKDTTATVTTSVRVGQVVVKHADGKKEQRGGAELQPDRVFTVGAGSTAVAVDARMVLGEIVIQEASS